MALAGLGVRYGGSSIWRATRPQIVLAVDAVLDFLSKGGRWHLIAPQRLSRDLRLKGITAC